MASLTNGAPLKMGFSLGTARKAAPPSKTPAKRSHALLEEDDKTSDPQADTNTITTFGAASKEGGKVAERVIPRQPNAERWNHGKKRRRTSPAGDAATRNGEEADGGVQDGMRQFGLVVPVQPPTDDSTTTPPAAAEASAQLPTDAASTTEPAIPPTADDEAVNALTGASTAQPAIRPSTPLTDSEAFSQDFQSAPPPNTLAQYTSTPVEGFGAALLRGMLPSSTSLEQLQKDWEAKAPKSLVRREKNENAMKGYRLGLGAKVSGLGIEKVDLRRKGGEEVVAGPLKRRNLVTGEEMTEQEFEARMARQREEDRLGRVVVDEGSSGRRKRVEGADGGERRESRKMDEDDEEERYRRRKREKERDRRRERDDDRKDSDRHRSRKYDREDDYDSERRHRRRDDEYDSERKHARDKDRARDREGHHGSRRRSRDSDGRRR
ncbi:MAG: hypothetical protein M1828_000164 [Chrysothrix sp. TS-e1954]|nr:MAG: hypothetical protein M1828_000164 [Chrysothrix sp. TS-e1954]